jgi:hypothetical protein
MTRTWLTGEDFNVCEKIQCVREKMNDQEVLAGIQQSKVGETGFYFLGIEALIIAGAIGYREQSWAAGIFAFLVVLILLSAMAAYEILGNFLLSLSVLHGVLLHSR